MIQYIEAKSILSRLREKDTFFGISYNMNLYRGCQHGCIYCDTRSECYRIGDISQISIKKNALELLHRELSSKRAKKATIGTGSMNDPYMPLEKEIELTRKALKLIADFRFPVHIITKSDLVIRDIDILNQIKNTYAAVSFTITTFDDDLGRKLEPNASLTSQRFQAMEKLASHGIYTGVTLMPMLPYINDSIENLTHLIKRAKDSGASYVLPMFGLTLRKGSREYFYRCLEHSFPGIKAKYEHSFGEQYICNSPNYYRLNDTFLSLTRQLKLDIRLKFYTPLFNNQLSIFP